MQQSSGSAVKNLDRAGMSASLLCAVHCAFLPLLLAALPAFGLAWLDSPVVDWSMFGIATCIALWSHRHGFVGRLDQGMRVNCCPFQKNFSNTLSIRFASK
jgi:MerC mercury resistance protein